MFLQGDSYDDDPDVEHLDEDHGTGDNETAPRDKEENLPFRETLTELEILAKVGRL